MRRPNAISPALLALVLSFWVAFHYTVVGNRALVWVPPWTYEQSSGDESTADDVPQGTSFERKRDGDGYILSYSFRDFNRSLLTLKARLPDKAVEDSLDEFGYTDADLHAVHTKNGKQGAKVYDRKLKEFLASRGFRLLDEDVVQADIPAMVKRNASRLNPVARSLDLLASSKHYGPEEIIAAATALVQTSIRYKVPPAVEKGVHIGGIHPPPKALVDGWGDCDTKTAVLGTLLQNWDGMNAVGLALPHHYLMGIARIPRKEDVYIEHEGAQYVLIEPAGPAWLPPGTVAKETLDMLDRMQGVPIQPF